MVSEGSKWFSIVDLKDAFFCIPINEQSQLWFAFEQQDRDTKAMLNRAATRIEELPDYIQGSVGKRLKGCSVEIRGYFAICR